MEVVDRTCCFEPVKDSPDLTLRQERARACRCNYCVEARSFAALNVSHSMNAEITDRISALMWRPTPAA